MHAGIDTRNVSLEQLVSEASDELLSEPDYSKQLDIVERITGRGAASVPGQCSVVCDAIGARLEKKKKSENVIYLLFHLMDFLLKNVTPQMAHVMSREQFQKHIIKLAKGKTVKGRAATLMICKVQEWAYIFQNHKGFQETYIALQKQGHDFPPPSRELMMEQSRLNERRLEKQAAKRAEVAVANDPLRRLKENLQLLRDNLNLVMDMLAAIDPAKENVRNNELILPLLEPIGQQRSKIAELLGTVTDEETLLVLLDLNDDINDAFVQYNELLQGRRVVRHREELEVSANSPASSPPNNFPLFAPPVMSSPPVVAATAAPPPPPYSANPLPPPPPYHQNDDPFAALAKARHAKDRTSGSATRPAPPPGAAAAPAQPVSALSSLDALFATPAPAPTVTHIPATYASSAPPPMYAPGTGPVFGALPPSPHQYPSSGGYGGAAPLYAQPPPPSGAPPLYSAPSVPVPNAQLFNPAPPVNNANPQLFNPYVGQGAVGTNPFGMNSNV